MTPKMAAERKSPSPYFVYEGRDGKGHIPGPDEVMRAKKLSDERSKLSLVGQLMGDPSPSRSALGCGASTEPFLAYITKCLDSHKRED